MNSKNQNDSQKKTKKGITAKDITFIALGICLLTVSAWITIPFAVPFTMQTFAVIFLCYFLGTFKSLIALAVYILIGFLGLPVFSGFSSGAAVIVGPTGGYLVGFVFTMLFVGLTNSLAKSKIWLKMIFAEIGLIFCYIFGTLWFILIFAGGAEHTFFSALTICVLPYILPDFVKSLAAIYLAKRVSGVFKQ